MCCPELAFRSLCQLNSCWRLAHYQFFFWALINILAVSSSQTRTTPVSMRTPIYLHLEDAPVGFVPELSCWESLRLSVSAHPGREIQGRIRETKCGARRRGEALRSMVWKTSLPAPKGTWKGGQFPGGCLPGFLVVSCGQGFGSGFIPSRGHWQLNEWRRRSP